MEFKDFKQHEIQNNIPVIRDRTEHLLIEKLKEFDPKKVLEIGTATGYSGTIILKNCNANLTTIEIDQTRFDLAKKNFETFKVAGRVSQILLDAKEFLKNTTEKFDFVFLDGAKGQYVNYLPHIKKLLNKNGILFCDNVLFKGLVESESEPPKKYRTIVKNLQQFLTMLKNDTDFQTVIYNIEDGVSFSIKIN